MINKIYKVQMVMAYAGVIDICEDVVYMIEAENEAENVDK